MGCACKSSNNLNRQVTQVTKRTITNSQSHTVYKVNPTTARKQIIIKRPAR